MGISSGEPIHARPGHGPDRGTDREEAQAQRGVAGLAAGLIALCLGATPGTAETLRIATWHVELARDGPGLLLRDIATGEAPDVAAVVDTLAHLSPDVILLTGIDHDHGLATLTALAEAAGAAGAAYPQRFALRPNSGLASGFDLDGDGRRGGPGDAQGYGRFAGQGGMALLSRLPIARPEVRDFSGLLWSALPGALLPEADGAPFPSAEALAVQRLSSVGHWDVPLVLPDGGRLRLLAFSAGPPVFDGPEDRNGRRNHDEIMFWSLLLDGELGQAPPTTPVVVIGNANLDPRDGDGRHAAIRALIDHPRLQDPRPSSAGGAEAAHRQGGANDGQNGDPALDTADWRDAPGPGNLRVSYVLPDATLSVVEAGVFWPAPGEPLHHLVGDGTPRHRLVWVDLVRDR